MRKTLSPEAFTDYLIKSYSRQQLLGIQLFMRNEEFNEMANQILSDLLKEQDHTEKEL